MTRDVVCNMQIDEEEAEVSDLTCEYQGRTFYFCSEECKDQFEENPQQFVGPPPGNQPQPGQHP